MSAGTRPGGRAPRRTEAVILAAGRGTRMRSDRAKVLHELHGRPLVTWVVRAVAPLVDRAVVVVGYREADVRAALAGENVAFAVQAVPEGTGHALLSARHELAEADELLVLAGDVPLLRQETLAACLAEHRSRGAGATVLTFVAKDPRGYGRILRGPGGTVEAIVEERDATEEQRSLAECNSGSFVFDAHAVLPLLDQLPRRTNGELYLTDVVGLLRQAGRSVAAVEAPESEAVGINSPEQLAEAERQVAAGRTDC